MIVCVILIALLLKLGAAITTKQSLVDLTSYNEYALLINDLYQLFSHDLPAADTYNLTTEEGDRIASIDFRVAMSPVEMSYFEQKLKQATIYFEFGAGGSTRLACKTNPNLTIFSVDSSLDFLMQVAHNDSCIQSRYNTNVFMYIASIGEVREWGYPIYNYTNAFAGYSSSIITGYSANPADIDLVLVDGRFRVACILQTLLVTSRDTVILVHDFYNRPEYFIVLLYVDVVDRVDTLVTLQRKRLLGYHDYVLMRQHLEIFRTVPA